MKENQNKERDPLHLTPEEQRALEALPRERPPSRELEQRTVAALKARGLLRGSPSWTTGARGWMSATAAAAAVALFAGGMALGQWMAARQTADALAALYSEPALQAAARVQRTGTAHVEALSDLTRVAGTADAEEAEQAREVALATFWAAAAEIVRLAPDDPLAASILAELERARQAAREAGAGGEGAGGAGEEAGRRNLVWF